MASSKECTKMSIYHFRIDSLLHRPSCINKRNHSWFCSSMEMRFLQLPHTSGKCAFTCSCRSAICIPDIQNGGSKVNCHMMCSSLKVRLQESFSALCFKQQLGTGKSHVKVAAAWVTPPSASCFYASVPSVITPQATCLFELGQVKTGQSAVSFSRTHELWFLYFQSVKKLHPSLQGDPLNSKWYIRYIIDVSFWYIYEIHWNTLWSINLSFCTSAGGPGQPHCALRCREMSRTASPWTSCETFQKFVCSCSKSWIKWIWYKNMCVCIYIYMLYDIIALYCILLSFSALYYIIFYYILVYVFTLYPIILYHTIWYYTIVSMISYSILL